MCPIKCVPIVELDIPDKQVKGTPLMAVTESHIKDSLGTSLPVLAYKLGGQDRGQDKSKRGVVPLVLRAF